MRCYIGVMRDVAKDMTGFTFGRLKVLERAPREPRFGKLAAWLCECECGNVVAVKGMSLRNGDTRSCGCLHRQKCRERRLKHDRSNTREYRSWAAAKTRCYNPRQSHWPHYGGRGITMCAEWSADFRAFLRDMGPCPEGYSLDRIDVNGNYEPGNCRWASPIQQANNARHVPRISFRGESHSVSEWARILGIPRERLKMRLQRGWTPERALTEPPRVR